MLLAQGIDRGFEEPFDAPDIDPTYYGPHIDLWVLVLIGVVLGVLMAICAGGLYAGRQRGLRRLAADRLASAEAIYASVRYYLDRALKSSGGVILERGREVGDLLEARLGYVLALTNKPGKIIQSLDKALEGQSTGPAPGPAPAKVKVALPTDAHYLEVWKALQALNTYWSDKPKIIAMIIAAQDELERKPRKETKPSMRKPEAVAKAVAAAVAGALHDADKAGVAPVITPEPAPDPMPDPTPPPPAPKPRGKLPAHKRNMLA
jgi:hypothetical protein